MVLTRAVMSAGAAALGYKEGVVGDVGLQLGCLLLRFLRARRKRIVVGAARGEHDGEREADKKSEVAMHVTFLRRRNCVVEPGVRLKCWS